MAKGKFDSKVDTTVLDNMLKNIGNNAGMQVVSIAKEVRDVARKRAPFFSGGLRASIHVRAIKGGDNISSVAGDVRARWNQMAGEFPSYADAQLTELPKPDNNRTAIVGTGASYAAPVEFGTATKAAHNYFVPAVRQVERKIANKLSKAITDKKLK